MGITFRWVQQTFTIDHSLLTIHYFPAVNLAKYFALEQRLMKGGGQKS